MSSKDSPRTRRYRLCMFTCLLLLLLLVAFSAPGPTPKTKASPIVAASPDSVASLVRSSPHVAVDNKVSYFESCECTTFFQPTECKESAVRRPRNLHTFEQHIRTCYQEGKGDMCLHRTKPSPRREGDIVIVHEAKLIYVDITKAGSTTIRDFLFTKFGASWCKKSPNEQFCSNSLRWKSSAITPEMMEEYFIFTFVRDPIQRYFSGVRQLASVPYLQKKLSKSFKRAGLPRTDITPASIAALLEAKMVPDEHLHTQAQRLSVRAAGNKELRFDFIGNVEQLSEGFEEVLKHARGKRAKELLRKSAEFHMGRLNDRGSTLHYSELNSMKQNEIDMICYWAAQDATCFHFDLPEVCQAQLKKLDLLRKISKLKMGHEGEHNNNSQNKGKRKRRPRRDRRQD